MRHLPALLALSLSVALAPQAVARTPAVLAIGQVQGSGPRSPLEGRQVTIEGFVSADLRAGLGGVFLQDAGDRDPATSDALFVQLDPARALPAGQWLRVTGTVQELAAGKGGQTLKWIGQKSREELIELLDRSVHLFLTVKVDPKWQDSRALYAQFGLEFDV